MTSKSLHTGGVTGSIPVAPTIKSPINQAFSDAAAEAHPAVSGGTIQQPTQSRGENPGTLFRDRSRLLVIAATQLPRLAADEREPDESEPPLPARRMNDE
jgi:hypothetical protein